MNREMGYTDYRLVVLGQIQVVRDRLDILEERLLTQNIGDSRTTEWIEDAIGNVSLQTGFLVGALTNLGDYRGKL